MEECPSTPEKDAIVNSMLKLSSMVLNNLMNGKSPMKNDGKCDNPDCKCGGKNNQDGNGCNGHTSQGGNLRSNNILPSVDLNSTIEKIREEIKNSKNEKD